MNEYIVNLKRYVAEIPPNYGSDAHSILEMLFTYYHECNKTDTVKVAFEELYQRCMVCPSGRWIGSWIPDVLSAGSMRSVL